MALGRFIFGLRGSGAAYQSLSRNTSQKWAKGERVGRRASNQHLGPGDDVLKIPGVIAPEICGPESALSLDLIRGIAEEGRPVNLILLNGARGDIAGRWVVLSVSEKQSIMLGNLPRKIEFSVSLRRDDGSTSRGLYR